MSKNIIFMINVVSDDDNKNQEYDISIKSWKAYAKKYNHELFVLEDKIFDFNVNINWYKFYILDLLELNNIDYNQVLYVEPNTIVHTNTPDIFNISDNKFCAVRYLGDMGLVCSSIEVYSKLIFNDDTFPYYNYFNGAVMIFNKTHKLLFKSIQKFCLDNIEKLNWIETNFQIKNDLPILNFFVHKNILLDDIKILDYEWNMHDMPRFEVLNENMLHTKYGYISQYDLTNVPVLRSWMRQTYNMLYNN